MRRFRADRVAYDIVCQTNNEYEVLPLIRANQGKEYIHCVSPVHGRSFILRQEQQRRWIVGKGNGLSYTTHPFVLTSFANGETWGGLSLNNALRDFNIGNEVRDLGVKTNHMQYVLSIDSNMIQNGEERQVALLQYSVECPYRISDFGFFPRYLLKETVSKWGNEFPQKHLFAARVLINNLRTLRDHHIMHNATHPQNYTWALELVDFEASRSDKYPFDNPDYEACVPMLSDIEIIQTYEIINYIAWCLRETPNYKAVEMLFKDYGFEINELPLSTQ